MHPVILENLEEYLSGTLLPKDLREFEAHLTACQECREEVRGMQEVSSLFTALRPVETIEPPLGFAARVTAQVAASRAPSFWSVFSLDPAFGRRVVFASLLTLAVLGSFLVSREAGYAPGPNSPESVMAAEGSSNSPNAPAENDRDMMLVTLTSYEP